MVVVVCGCGGLWVVAVVVVVVVVAVVAVVVVVVVCLLFVPCKRALNHTPFWST